MTSSRPADPDAHDKRSDNGRARVPGEKKYLRRLRITFYSSLSLFLFLSRALFVSTLPRNNYGL